MEKYKTGGARVIQYLSRQLAIQAAGYVVNENDKKSLSPLMHGHSTIVGKYFFNTPQEVVEGKLRPLQPMDNKLFGKFHDM